MYYELCVNGTPGSRSSFFFVEFLFVFIKLAARTPQELYNESPDDNINSKKGRQKKDVLTGPHARGPS